MLTDAQNRRQQGCSSRGADATIVKVMRATLNLASTRGAFIQLRRAAVAMGTVLVIAASLPLVGEISYSDLASLVALAVVFWIGSIGGARSGAVAAATAAAAYTLVMLPELLSGSGSASVVVRTLAFFLVGIGSGFLISRLRDVLDRIETSGHHDDESNTFSAAYMRELLHLLSEEHRRYGKSFGVIEVPAVLTNDEVPEIGLALRRVIRGSDAIGRSEDGGFLIVLPNADRDVTRKVARRLKGEFSSPERPEIPVRAYSAPEDLSLLEEVGASLTQEANSGRD